MGKQEFRQGDIVEGSDAEKLLSLSVDKEPERIDDSHTLVILSQDCDVVHDEDRESYIEFALCRQADKLDENLKHGKNPRLLQIEEKTVCCCCFQSTTSLGLKNQILLCTKYADSRKG